MKNVYVLFIIITLLFISCKAPVSGSEDIEGVTKLSELKANVVSLDIEKGKEGKIIISSMDNRKINKITWKVDNNIIDVTSDSKDNLLFIIKGKEKGQTSIVFSEDGTNNTLTVKINIKNNSSELKKIIKDKTTIRENEYEIQLLPIEYEYSKPGVDFSIVDYRVLLKPDDSIELCMVNEKGEIERDVQWFIDSRIFSSSDLVLFSVEETKESTDSLYNMSPVILDDKENGKVIINGTNRFISDNLQIDGLIIAVVDGKYVHRKPFSVLNATDIDMKAKHEETEKRVKELSEPLMKYSDVEKAFLINKTVCENLVYDEAFYGRPSDYNTFCLGKAVCQGYSWMMTRLGEEVGLRIRDLHGDSGLGKHAWNAVIIDDEYYYVDSTWNDLEEIPNNNLLDLFFVPKDVFETNPVINVMYTHEALLEGKKFGTKYLNIKEYYADVFNSYLQKFNENPAVSENKIKKPDMNKIVFTGNGTDSGFLVTQEDGIEYSTGDGKWHLLTANQKTLVKGIKQINKSCFTPRTDNYNFIGYPRFILLRRRQKDNFSNYEKLTVYQKNSSPNWIKVTDGGVIEYVNDKMEYRKDTETSYTAITKNFLTLAPGTYHIRFSGKNNYFASDDTIIKI